MVVSVAVRRPVGCACSYETRELHGLHTVGLCIWFLKNKFVWGIWL